MAVTAFCSILVSAGLRRELGLGGTVVLVKVIVIIKVVVEKVKERSPRTGKWETRRSVAERGEAAFGPSSSR